MAHALQIDTLAFANKLKAAGADEGLANAIVEGITAADTSELATKADIQDVRNEIKDVESALRSDIQDVRTEIKDVESALRTEIKDVESALRSDIQDVRTEIKHLEASFSTDLKWIKGFGAIIVAVLVVPILADGAARIMSFYIG